MLTTIISFCIVSCIVLLSYFAVKESFMSFKSVRGGNCGCNNQLSASGTVYSQNIEENTGLGWVL